MKKWFKNITYSLWGKAIGMLCLVLLDVCIARFYSVEEYSEWVYFFSILTMLIYFGWFGINTSVKVHVSKCITSEENINCLKAALLLRFAVSTAVMLLITLIMPAMAVYLGFPEKYPSLQWLLTVAGVLVFLNSFTEFYKEYFIGKDQFKKVFFITIVEYAGYLMYSVLGMLIFRSIGAIAIGYILAGITVSIVGIRFLYAENKCLLKDINQSFKRFLASIFRYAIPIAVISLGGLVLVEMDIFMLGLLSTNEEVAIYSIAKNLCSKVTHINYSMSVGVMTTFSVITKENYNERRVQYNKATGLNWMLTLTIAVLMYIFADVAISILYGKDYIKSGSIIQKLVLYYVFYGISNYYSTFLDFRNRAGVRSIMYLSVMVINLVLNYLWIPLYGAEGAALATELSLLPYTIIVIVFSKNEWKKLKQVL